MAVGIWAFSACGLSAVILAATALVFVLVTAYFITSSADMSGKLQVAN